MALFIIGSLILIASILYLYFIHTPTTPIPMLSAAPSQQSIQIAGKTRTFLTYQPAQLSPSPALIIVLHGTGINGAKMREWTGYEFDQAADKNGFIVAYPDGYEKDWNDCRKGNFSNAKKENVDDVGFITAIINKYKVDPGKVYLFGYSAGGMMAYRFAMEHPQLSHAIATICAALPTPETNLCKIPDSLPRIMIVNGTADRICPVNGGELNLFGRKRGFVVAALETAQIFAGGSSTPIITQHGTVTQYAWSDKVVLYLVNGGGHVIPQPAAKFPRLMGHMSADIDAPATAIHFFGF